MGDARRTGDRRLGDRPATGPVPARAPRPPADKGHVRLSRRPRGGRREPRGGRACANCARRPDLSDRARSCTAVSSSRQQKGAGRTRPAVKASCYLPLSCRWMRTRLRSPVTTRRSVGWYTRGRGPAPADAGKRARVHRPTRSRYPLRYAGFQVGAGACGPPPIARATDAEDRACSRWPSWPSPRRFARRPRRRGPPDRRRPTARARRRPPRLRRLRRPAHAPRATAGLDRLSQAAVRARTAAPTGAR